MRKTTSILLVGLMIIGMVGCVQAVAENFETKFPEERNDLEELVGLEVDIIYQITGTVSVTHPFHCQGIIVEIREDWIIILIKKKRKDDRYVWCYIPTIRKIAILDKDYKPVGEE